MMVGGRPSSSPLRPGAGARAPASVDGLQAPLDCACTRTCAYVTWQVKQRPPGSPTGRSANQLGWLRARPPVSSRGVACSR
eukprot:scaffold4392_cov277-Prasinococcus_capsulatus_cf.AAC.3